MTVKIDLLSEQIKSSSGERFDNRSRRFDSAYLLFLKSPSNYSTVLTIELWIFIH